MASSNQKLYELYQADVNMYRLKMLSCRFNGDWDNYNLYEASMKLAKGKMEELEINITSDK